MVLNERQTQLADYINEHTSAKVKSLASIFCVSEMTIRRDLRELQKQGYLHRFNGGATRCAENEVLPFEARKLLHDKDKTRIIESVRPLITDGISVFIDSSATCLCIIPLLKEFDNIRIFTNSLPASLKAAEYHIKCTLAGGTLHSRDLCTVGTAALDFMRQINVDIAFFSSQAISADGKITDSDEQQTAIRRAALKNCAKSVLLIDKSKQSSTPSPTDPPYPV